MAKNRACPACREAGHDKKGDHLFCMEDGYTWHCDKMYHEPYYERDGEEVAFTDLSKGSEVEMIKDVSGFKAESIRGIPKDIVEKYGIRVEHSTATGEPTKHYYPITTNRGVDIVAWKVRVIETKDFYVSPAVPEGTKVDLFGMKSSPFKPSLVVITEGELDAVAAHWMMKGRFTRYMCLSLPFGAKGMNALLDSREFLKGLDVVYCPDKDEEGKASVDKIALILPDVRIAKMSEKDACDMLKAGKKEEFMDAIDAAKTWSPSSIVSVSDILEDAMKPVERGLSYPFERLSGITYGCPTRSIIGIGAGPGAGKTSFVKAIQTHLMFHHRQKVGIFSLEETPKQTLRSLGGHIIHKPVHLPDCEYDETTLRCAIESLDGLVHMYDHHGYKDWDDIASAIAYMVHHGVKYIFIDPLSALVAHLSASDANTYLNNAMFTLSKLTQALDFTVFHVNHLNNPDGGKDHGAGGKVYGSQFTGSRAMWKFSTDMWGLERNQLAEDPDEKNKLRVVVLKNRLSGITDSFHLRYNRSLGILEEIRATGVFLPEPMAEVARMRGPSVAKDDRFAELMKTRK
jgi:twinkle protein